MSAQFKITSPCIPIPRITLLEKQITAYLKDIFFGKFVPRLQAVEHVCNLAAANLVLFCALTGWLLNKFIGKNCKKILRQ